MFFSFHYILIFLTFMVHLYDATDFNSKSCEELGKYLPDLENCNKFYHCSPSGWVTKFCLPGLEFNTAILNCDSAQNVQCSKNLDRGIKRKSKRNPIKIEVLEKERAVLPCNITTPTYNESVKLIVWYKDKDDKSVFSEDRRRNKKWSSDDRIKFFSNKNPAELVIDNIKKTDAGVYRCSIDYSKSASGNRYIELDVIVPPDEMKIIDENGKILSSTTGPRREGDDVTLRCVVYGGTPPPNVGWLRNNNILGEAIQKEYVQEGIKTKELTIRNITRSIIQDSFTCRAFNTNKTRFPLEMNTKVDVRLPPLYVKIETSVSLSAKKAYKMTCKSFGSRPPAKIEWLIGKEIFNSGLIRTVTGVDDSSVSILTFTPTREQNGLDLVCRAHNNYLHQSLENSIPLNISYSPQPIVELGTNYNPEYINEGDDVYFECRANAYPRPNKLVWLHNNRSLQNDKKNGIYIQNTYLNIKKITKYQKGNYQCMASNTEGYAISEAFKLRIRYKPICKAKQFHAYGVERMKTAEVKCEVESHPPPTNFEWKFNSSANNNEISSKRIINRKDKFLSIVRYKPLNELDYGTLLCWAENAVGKQSEPCVFHVVPVGKPDRPSNCTLFNVSSYSLEIRCLQGYDGGLHQTARLEVYDKMSSVLLKNATSEFSSIVIEDLEAGKSLIIIIYSENSKGRSDPLVLNGETLIGEDKLSVLAMDEESRLGIVPLLGIIIGVVFILIILSLAALIMIKLKKCKFRTKSSVFSVDNSKINPAPQKTPNGRDFSEKDENNPDIIPVYANITQQSTNNSIQPSPHEKVYTTTESFWLPKNREPELYALTYVELEPIPLVHSDIKKLIPTKNKEDRVIYADIEHNRKDSYWPKKSITGPVVSVESLFSSGKSRNHQREVVTTKAPFMGHHQESCV